MRAAILSPEEKRDYYNVLLRSIQDGAPVLRHLPHPLLAHVAWLVLPMTTRRRQL